MPYTIAALALAATVLLSGCGQMGPLYEPPADADPAAVGASKLQPPRAV